jgi:hypothetical protein
MTLVDSLDSILMLYAYAPVGRDDKEGRIAIFYNSRRQATATSPEAEELTVPILGSGPLESVDDEEQPNSASSKKVIPERIILSAPSDEPTSEGARPIYGTTRAITRSAVNSPLKPLRCPVCLSRSHSCPSLSLSGKSVLLLCHSHCLSRRSSS